MLDREQIESTEDTEVLIFYASISCKGCRLKSEVWIQKCEVDENHTGIKNYTLLGSKITLWGQKITFCDKKITLWDPIPNKEDLGSARIAWIEDKD